MFLFLLPYEDLEVVDYGLSFHFYFFLFTHTKRRFSAVPFLTPFSTLR